MINEDFHPNALKRKIKQQIPRSLPYYDNSNVSSDNQDPIVEELMKLHPHYSSVIIAKTTDETIVKYSKQISDIINPLLSQSLDDDVRIQLETSLDEIIQIIPRPQQHNHDQVQPNWKSEIKFYNLPKTEVDPEYAFPNNYLLKILIDNFDLLKRFSLTYFNLSLASNVTKFMVELIYELNYWEAVHLVHINPDVTGFLKLIGFDIISTPMGPIIKQPMNYLNDKMLQGLLYPHPYPFYNYSYHSFNPKTEGKKFSKVHITPYSDITLKNVGEPLNNKRQRSTKRQKLEKSKSVELESAELEHSVEVEEASMSPRQKPKPNVYINDERNGTVSDIDLTSDEDIDITGQTPEPGTKENSKSQKEAEIAKDEHAKENDQIKHPKTLNESNTKALFEHSGIPQQYPITPGGFIYPPPPPPSQQFAQSPPPPQQQYQQGNGFQNYQMYPFHRPFASSQYQEQFYQNSLPHAPQEEGIISPASSNKPIQHGTYFPNITPIQNFQPQSQHILPSFNNLTEVKNEHHISTENPVNTEQISSSSKAHSSPTGESVLNENQSQQILTATPGTTQFSPPPFIDPVTQTITYPPPPPTTLEEERSRRAAQKHGAIHQCHMKDANLNQKCLKIFYGKNELLRHQEFVHASKKKIYKCIYCEREGSKVQSYPRHDSLARHIRRKHNITGKENKMAVNYAKENVEVIEESELSIQQLNTQEQQQKKHLKSMQDQFKLSSKQETQVDQQSHLSVFDVESGDNSGLESRLNIDNEGFTINDNEKEFEGQNEDKKSDIDNVIDDDIERLPALGNFGHNVNIDNIPEANDN